ncbi:TOBE domain-containing protein [Roseicyclus sp.]|uniref:TOBE domain-containing protein n=1 Tax=Roseicyclus sp. TaxID=1914329 RepID=UPI001BCB791A|nr:TOBE domain-containing protein [Roseicyclus sp.]
MTSPEALAMSDRIAVLDQGDIVDVGTPTGLYSAPRTAFLATFLGQANLLPVTIDTRTEDDCTASSAWGRFTLPSARLSPELNAAPGTAALAVIRPEHLTVAEGEGPPSAIRIAVTVTQALYNGSETIYSATCNGERPRTDATRQPAGAGDLCGWGIDAAEC